MNIKKFCIRTLSVSALCFLTAAFAQEAEKKPEQTTAPMQEAAAESKQEEATPQELPPITVTGVRTNARPETLGQTVAIIDRKQIEATKLPFVTDILREQPGLNFFSYGPLASNSTISIRGMHRYHTKLLIDGIPYIDNSQTAGLAPMFDSLSLSLIDRIEIVKGAVSLQGSSAMGGIVNIITRKPPEDENVHGEFNVEAGSHGRFDTSAILYGRASIVDYKVGVARQRERGISVYRGGPSAYMTINGDDDHFRSMTYFADLGIQLGEQWRLEFGGAFTDTDEEYDDGYLETWNNNRIVPDDDDIWFRKGMAHAKLEGKELFNGALDLSFSYAQTRADRQYIGVPAGNGSRYIGDFTLLNSQATLHINDWNTLTAGLDFQHEQVRGTLVSYTNRKYKGWDETYRSLGYYVGYQMEPVENLFLNANFRYNHHSDFDHEWTGDISARYLLEATGTTFRTSYGKGYRAPNPYELMPLANNLWFWRGNPNLKPEKSRTWDIGLEQDILEKTLTADITYFENAVEDYINAYGGYDARTYMSYPTNVEKMKIRGIEAGLNAKPVEDLTLRVAYTWQHARNIENGEHFRTLIADHLVNFDATWTPIEQLELNIGGVLVGPRQNTNGAGSANKMHNYCLMHAAAAWKFTKNFKVYARIDNLLNENYATTDSYGIIYNTYGRVYYVGLNFSF